MPSKKILIVANSFYPTLAPRAFRATELAKELSRQGHFVKVIICENDFDFNSFSKEYNIEIETYKRTWIQSIRIGKNPNSLLNRITNRLLSLLFEYPEIEIMFRVANKLKREFGYDALISIAVPYPVHWGVARVIKMNKGLCTTWIADCGDPFMGCNQYNNIYNSHPFYFKYIEKWFCRKANFITVPIEKSILGYFAEFRSKIRVIPQGFNFEEITIISKTTSNKVLTFGYAGVFSKGYRDPRPFLDYLSTIKSDFKFIVYTNQSCSDLISTHCQILNNKLEIHNFIPRSELLNKLSCMDFVINFENIMETQTPSKLIDYAMTDRPILSINTAKINYAVITEFFKRDYTNRYIVKDLEQYNIRNVSNAFIKLME